MKRKIAKGFQLWAAGYSTLTVISCIAQLLNGNSTDTNLNGIARALACLAPIVTYHLFGFGTDRKWTKALLLGIAHYAISLGCALLLIYLAGLLQHNAQTAYLDIFISFTVAYAAIAVILGVSHRRARKEEKK